MTSKTLIGFYREHASDLPELLRFTENNFFDMVVTQIVNPLFYREFTDVSIKSRHGVFTRSDLIVEPTTWSLKIISKLSDYIDCDSADPIVRGHSEATLKQEMIYAQHLAQQGSMLVKLKGSKTVNLARIVTRNISGLLLVEVPMVDPKLLTKMYRGENDESSENTWQWWNKFRTYADYNLKVKVALELSSDLPAPEEILRWLGEPVEILCIRSDIFILNKKNYPVLSRAHQAVVLDFLNMGANLVLKANAEDHSSLRNYVEYLKYLITQNQRKDDPLRGYDDLLEIPLQPLCDNLDTYTYEIFEKDPIKYIMYQNAIESALIDKIDEIDIATKSAIVMVVGAGRGPLVRSAINASINTKRKIKILVIEKNPNAIITLSSLKEEMWSDIDLTIIPTDMRDFVPAEKADILVSELLGSFGDNELSPECLDGAQKHLKDDGISIPCKSTSYINPIMAPKFYHTIRESRAQQFRAKPATIEQQCESSYVVYMKNVYHIASPQPLFTFEHPNRQKVIDNSRYNVVTFEITQDCVLHGFAGYFDTVLYKDIEISIHPETHSRGLSSWFPMYFPIAESQQLKSGNVLEVHFWRCVSERKVWYEWCIRQPNISHIHNVDGRSCSIKK